MAQVTPERIDRARDAARRLLILVQRLPAELRGLQEASIPADEKDAALVAKFYGLQPAITEAQAAMPSDILDCVMLAAGPGDYIIDGRFHEGTAHAATEILARRKLLALARAVKALRLSLTEPLPRGSGYVDPPDRMRSLLESGFGHAAVLLMLRSESEQVREGFWKAAIADVDAVAVPTQLWAAVDKEWAAARRAIAADALAAGAQPQGQPGAGNGHDAAPAGGAQPEKPADGFCVRLSQAAGVAGRSKRTLQNWQKDDADFPLPVVEGGGGKPAEWRWGDIRPYLEKRVGRPLPEWHPADVNRADFAKEYPGIDAPEAKLRKAAAGLFGNVNGL